MDEARAGFLGAWRGLPGCGGVTPAKQWGVARSAGGALAGDDDEVAVRGGRKVGDRERPPV